MPIRLERVTGDEADFGRKRTDDTLKVEWYLTGTFVRTEAETYALANLPPAAGHRGLESIKLKELPDKRDGAWQVTGNYKGPTIKEPPEDPPPDPTPTITELGVSFSVGGGARFMTHSLETIQVYSAPAPEVTAPTFLNQLNLVDGIPEGVDVNPSSMAESTFTVEQEVPTVLITNAWLLAIETATFCTNNATFRGRAIGEVLFNGLRGTYKTNEQLSTLSWEFLVIKNKPAHTVGVFTGVVKKGWEYAWIYSEEREKTSGTGPTYKSQIVHAPIGLYIERLFEPIDMGGIGVVA